MNTLHNIGHAALLYLALCGIDAGAATVQTVQDSSPAGMVSVVKSVEMGASLTTTNAPETYQTYRFGVWRVNGADSRDMLGHALNPVSMTVYEPITATAYYWIASEDANTNAIPDWWEMAYSPTLLANASSDADGDGFTALEEYRRDTHPNVADTLVSGGISLSCSSSTLVISKSNLVSVCTGSIPFGLYKVSSIATNRGSVVVFPDLYGVSNGYRFVCWQVNGETQTDVVGQAVGYLSLTLQSNTVVQAVYTLQNSDADGDSIPDWYEYQFFGWGGGDPAGDADADGFTLLEEYRRDSYPRVKDELKSGGVSVSFSALSSVIMGTNSVRFLIGCEPSGVLPDTLCITNKGTVFNLPDRFGLTNGYRFAYWTVDGVVKQDMTGRAVGGFQYTLVSNTVAKAVYVLESKDANTNAIPDWFELHFSGGLMPSVTVDGDGDGFDFKAEYLRDYDPDLSDTVVNGGVSVSVGPSLTVNTVNTIARYSISSNPQGLIPTVSAVTNVGATIVQPDVYESVSGYRFAYWTVNGAVQTDLTGRASGGFTLCIRSNSVMQAVFLLENTDSNANGICDWYEYHCLGGLSNGAIDHDGDGLSLLEEYRRDYHPLLKDEVRNGGVSVSVSQDVVVKSVFFSRISQCLLNGVSQPFFSVSPPGTGTFAVAGNSCPTLGDWDGDGDVDLFVGGAGGALRIFENTGTPTVANWKEQTGLFAAVAPVWNSISNPVPALGDWSGDGQADLVIGGNTNVVLLIASTGAFSGPPTNAVCTVLSLGGGNLAIPALCDMTGDGWLDLLVLRDDGRISLYTNRCDALQPFAAPSVTTDLLGLPVPEACGLAAMDADGDGDEDLLVSDSHGRIWEFVRDASGAFTLKSRIYAGSFDGFASRLTIAASDLDGDGDTDLICGYAEGGLVFLRNNERKLQVTPVSETLLSGESLSFAAPATSGAVSWSIRCNRSGGTIDASTGYYSAGTNSGVLDLVEATDRASGLSGCSYVNVIGKDEVSRVGKAVIIAGRASSTDAVWPTTSFLGNNGYNTLRYKGYGRENIRYLSPVTGSDVDGDGLANDIAALSTRANVADAFTNWVGHTDRLFVYLVDHGGESGGEGFFRLNSSETISATELNGWLTALQESSAKTEVTLVIDCCNSGSFLHSLAYTGSAQRVVIAACGAAEPTVFVAGGLVSFSEAFFAGLMMGLSAGEAFVSAQSVMSSYQSACMDDDGDGLYDASDGQVAAAEDVGASFVAGKDIPQMGMVSDNVQLTGDQPVTFWASDIMSSYAITRVWCMVVPPSHQPDPNNPVIDLPQLELAFNSVSQRYEADYAGFSEVGTYKIIYYAKDVWGSVSQPRQSYVTQSGFAEKAILLTGGTADDADWQSKAHATDYAYLVLRQRRFPAEAIRYLSASAAPAVGAAPSYAELAGAVTNWASGATRLTVYLAGICGTDGQFRLNGSETLSAGGLSALLSLFQTSGGKAVTVMDFDGAGNWLPGLAGQQRINTASSSAKQHALFRNKGMVSYSWLFMDYVFNGFDVWNSFDNARTKIFNASGRKQSSLLDANGDGAYAPKVDQVPARQSYLGSAFLTGADAPTIDAVTPDTVIGVSSNVLLWASGVADIGGISNVFCLVTAPNDDGASDLQEISLTWNEVSGRYEAVVSGFTVGGEYVCTFFAADRKGQISLPQQTLVNVVAPDAYEPDDTPLQASVFEVGTAQTHNLHSASDQDWTMFYAPSGYVFQVSATQLGTNSDLKVKVFYAAQPGVEPVALDDDLPEVDDNGTGEGIAEELTLDLSGEWPLPAGFYYVRVMTSDDVNLWGAGSEYQLEISSAQGAGGGALIVVAIDKLNSALPPTGARVLWDGTNAQAFGTANSLQLNLSEGVHTVRVTTAAGYLPEEDPAVQGEVTNSASYWYGNPKQAAAVAGSPRMAVFLFVPVVQARGKVVDRLTGESVAGARLAFSAPTGMLAGLTFDGFPSGASYKSAWVTASDGAFPTNVWLPMADWDLTVSCVNYTNLVRAPAVALQPAGSVTNLGTLLLSPVDLNANGIADAWERRYGLTNCTTVSDADRDLCSDRAEYLAGTDPTNRLSYLRIVEMIKSPAAGYHVKWTSAAGRSYRVYWSATATQWPTGQSIVVGATNAWRDASQPRPPVRFYRVGVELP